MLRSSLLGLWILCGAVLIGCSKSETTGSTNKPAESSNPAASTPAPAATNTTASTGEKIGVPECDDFIAKYDACVSSKVPTMVRGQYQSMLKQWRDSWKKLAENPKTKPTLVAACKQAAEQQATALKAYGCAF